MTLQSKVLSPFETNKDFSETYATLISRSQGDNTTKQEINNQKRIDKRKVKPVPSDTTIGLMDIHQVLTYIPISRSSWLEGVRTGRYPSPVRLSARRVAWRITDIKSFIDSL